MDGPKSAAWPVELQAFVAFHRSIRDALGALATLCTSAEHGDPIDPHRVAALHDFFAGPLRWHDDDERELLLAALIGPSPALYDDQLRAAALEHEALDDVGSELTRHLRAIVETATAPDVARLRAASTRLQALLQRHLAREEETLFPAAAALLSAEAWAAIALARGARARSRHLPPAAWRARPR